MCLLTCTGAGVVTSHRLLVHVRCRMHMPILETLAGLGLVPDDAGCAWRMYAMGYPASSWTVLLGFFVHLILPLRDSILFALFYPLQARTLPQLLARLLPMHAAHSASRVCLTQIMEGCQDTRSDQTGYGSRRWEGTR